MDDAGNKPVAIKRIERTQRKRRGDAKVRDTVIYIGDHVCFFFQYFSCLFEKFDSVKQQRVPPSHFQLLCGALKFKNHTSVSNILVGEE